METQVDIYLHFKSHLIKHMHKLTVQFYKIRNLISKIGNSWPPKDPYHSSAAARGPVSLTGGLGTAGTGAVLGSVGVRRSLYYIEIRVLCNGSGTVTNQSTDSESYARHEFPFQNCTLSLASEWSLIEHIKS